MADRQRKLVVIGAGPMGLAAAHHAAKRGFSVDVAEAGPEPGGMAAHFDFDGLSIERFYHFCCLSDHDTFALLEELGLKDAMRWRATKMGFFMDGALHPWGGPIPLLLFPLSKLGLIGRVRYGLNAFHSTKRKDWSKLDPLTAEEWLISWLGRKVYDRFWRPLLWYKFYEHTPEVSAAWVWQRMARVGNSRKSLFEERLGYIEGGTQTLVDALATSIEGNGGRIHLSAPAARIRIEDGRATGVETKDGRAFDADVVISTAPTPFVPALLGDAPAEMRAAYGRIKNVGVVCVMHRLKRSVSDNFWVNISDARLEIPGVIEFSNLRPTPDPIVYVPYYMPHGQEKWGWSDEAFIEDSFAALKLINPELTDDDRIASHVGRLKYAQPVFEPRFDEIVPPAKTPVEGLWIADTAYYYPEDRGVSESVGFAKRMIEEIAG